MQTSPTIFPYLKNVICKKIADKHHPVPLRARGGTHGGGRGDALGALGRRRATSALTCRDWCPSLAPLEHPCGAGPCSAAFLQRGVMPAGAWARAMDGERSKEAAHLAGRRSGAQKSEGKRKKVKAWERVVQSSAHPVQGRLVQHWDIQLLPFLVSSDQLAILF